MEEQSEDFRSLSEDSLFIHQPKYRGRARSAWYVYGHKNGQGYVVKAGDEEEANRINWSKYDGNGTVEEIDTIDTAKATQMIKAKWLHQNRTLEEATRRAKHNV